MDLLPLRAAAGGGSVDGFDAAQLVAAGFTLLQRSAPLVRALAGGRAGILLPTSPAFLTALAASDGRGTVLINPLAAPDEIAQQVRDAGIGAVFTVGALQGKLSAGLPRVLLDESPTSAVFTIPGGDEQRIDLGSHFGLSLEGDADAPGRDEECAILYTSAMAGAPLGAILTHRNLMANARQTVEAAANTADDHVLAVLPYAHLFGLTTSLTAPLFAGARITTMARFNPLAAVEIIEREGVTEIVGVPAMFAAMLTAIERRGGFRRARLRLCICGGAPLRPGIQERWEDATGVALRQGYGLTEASPVCLFNRVQEPNVVGTLGLPFPGVRVSIRDLKRGAEVEDGSEGEICVAGETVFRGYVGDGESVRGAAPGDVATPGAPGPTTGPKTPRGLVVRDGWLHSGDRGVRRADGRVEFRGRSKPMFTRRGYNVYPAEVERVIGQMPGVHSVRVTAIPDSAEESEIAVEIVGKSTRGRSSTPGMPTPPPPSEADVRAWCEARLASYKHPARITIVSG